MQNDGTTEQLFRPEWLWFVLLRENFKKEHHFELLNTGNINIKDSNFHMTDRQKQYQAVLADSHILQTDLNNLVQWEHDWSTEFHPDQCKCLRITNERKIINVSYFIHGVQLENVDQAKYLGLTITKNLSWKKHISNIISKATNVRLYLQRNLLYFDKEFKLLCYKVFVRPILEYACPVWSPNGTH